MKTLNDYTADKTSALLKKHGVFFAFSNKQLEEKAEKDVEYISLGAGAICPKKNARQYVQEQADIVKNAIAEDIADHGIDRIIRRELSNYECYYTGSIDSALTVLKEYNATREQVQAIYNAGYNAFWEDN